jgi:transcriptional regulator with XRE-family HTH domain
MCPIFKEEDYSKRKKEIKALEYSKDYSIDDFNNRINEIKKENNWTFKEIASRMGISSRWLLYLRKGEYKSTNINQKTIVLFNESFPFWFCIGYIRKYSKGKTIEWTEIETHTYRGQRQAEHRLFIMEQMYTPLNNAELIGSLVSNNPIKIAGRLKYWLNHDSEIINFRETEIFISELKESIKTKHLPKF